MIIPFNFRSVLAVALGLIGISLYFLYYNSRDKSEYSVVTGQITLLAQEYGRWPIRNHGKFRYLQVEGYPYVFEIFIGKDPGDFSPKFEQIDSLKKGDIVSMYYYETDDTRAVELNRFAKFIDKDNRSFYEDGSSAKAVTMFIVVVGVLLVGGSALLWKKGKMPF
jgi:hypothetical protein